MNAGPYAADCDSTGTHYVRGPGIGFSYYGGILFPFTRFATKELAEQAALCVNVAYRVGYEEARREIKRSLGLLP